MTAGSTGGGRSTRLLAEGARRPGRALSVGWALLKGHFCRLSCRLRKVRFRAGANLRVYGRLVVRGPGEVVLGDNVVVNGVATPWTYRPEARIVVGDNVIIGPARFGCVKEIVIGRDCLLGKAVLMDTDFHSTRADRRSETAPIRVAPVRIGNNVWIGENAAVLPGTVIGDNSVVGYGAVCMRDFPANVVILGNPAKVAAPIPSAEADAVTGASARMAV